MKKHIQILLLLLVFLCGACSSSGPGSQNPITPTPPVPVFGNFVLGVAASQNGVVLPQLRNQVVLAHPQVHSLVSVENNGIQIRETRNVVSDISFEGDNELVPQIEFPETYVVRLIQNGSIVNQEFPSFGVKNIAFDTYRKFEMKFEKINQGLIPPSILPDPITEQFLLDRSVVIEGSFLESHDLNNDGQLTYLPFRILSDKNVSIEVVSPNPFAVEQNKINYFFIAFRIERWFQGLLPELQNVNPASFEKGVLTVSKESSDSQVRKVLDLFEDNLDLGCKSAPSNDDIFNESDVDEDSSSNPI